MIESTQVDHFAFDIARLRAQLEAAQMDVTLAQRGTFSTLLTLMNFRNAGKGAHMAWVGLWSRRIAFHMGMSEEFCSNLGEVAKIHDIGLLGLPDSILNKSSPLSEDERALVEMHPRIGALMIISYGDDKVMELARNVVLHHHENFDGSGYPSGLAGDDIPLEARILAVADAFESMLQPSVFRPAKSTADALDIITEGRCVRFDPSVVDTFLTNQESILAGTLET